MELIQDIRETKEESVATMKLTQRAIFSRYAWEEGSKDAWVDCGFITKTAECGLQWYLELLDHLLHTANTQSWEEAQREIDLRVKEITLIRRVSANRLLCLCKIYIYLREAAEQNWASAKLERKRMEELTRRMKTVEGGKVCPKCKTNVHGEQACPWSRLSSKNAQKAAQKALTNLAKGGPVAEEEKEE
jgi:hypothetical protein